MIPVIGKYLKIGGVLVFVSAIAAAGYFKLQADRLSAELETEQQARESAEETVNNLTRQRDRDLAALGSLRSELSQSRSAMREAIEQLEELKRNETMVQADPASAEQLINDRLDRLFVVLSCTSGSIREDCQDTTREAGAAESPGSRAEGPSPE